MPTILPIDSGYDFATVSYFGLEVQGLVTFFKEATGFGSEHEVAMQKVTDSKGNTTVRKIPGTMKWDDLVLKRGMDKTMDLYNWRQEVVNGKVTSARKDGSLMFFDGEGNIVARFNFVKGWPSKYKGPDANSENTAVAVEEMTIVHEGIERVQ